MRAAPGAGRRRLLVVLGGLQQDVLGLQVGVDELQVVQVRHRPQQLPPELAHGGQRERLVAVLAQEVVQAEPQPLKDLRPRRAEGLRALKEASRELSTRKEPQQLSPSLLKMRASRD